MILSRPHAAEAAGRSCESRGAGCTLLVLGDSVALGATAIDGVRVVARVDRSFVETVTELAGWRLVIDAVPLRTTHVAATELPRLLDVERPDLLLIATGANDVDIDWRRFVVSRGEVVRSRSPLRAYGAALRSMAVVAKEKSVPLAISETFSCSLSRRVPHLSSLLGQDVGAWVEAAGGQTKCNEIVRDFRAVAREIAEEFGATLIPIGSAFDAGPVEGMLAADGTHPNQAGHDLIADVCLAHLRSPLDTVAR